MHIPIQVWHEAAQRLALMNLCNQKEAEIVSVPTFEYEGFLYMGNGATYMPYSSNRSSSVSAYRLLPEVMFTGKTTTKYHDEEAIANGSRRRGDLTGLIVSVNRRKMVCAERTTFLATLPTTVPLKLSEAKEFDLASRKYGWRVFTAKGVEPTWDFLRGHPVAFYVDHDKDVDLRVLYWKYQNSVMEMSLHNDIPMDDGAQDDEAQSILFSTNSQFQLF